MTETLPLPSEDLPPSPAAPSQPFQDDAAKRLRTALGFNVVFAEEFKILRPYLGRTSRTWPVKIHEMVMEHEELRGKFSSADSLELDRLMEAYIREMRSGRFYEAFFEAVEDLAQFFIQRQVQNSWLVGAFMNVFYDAQLEIFFDKEARQGRVVVAALRCLLKIMTLTIQILNRASFTQLEKSASDLAPF